MQKYKEILWGLVHALATLAYIAGVAWIMNNGSTWFGEADTALTPVFILLLFVISACITSLLVLGRPIMLFFNGAKKEAFVLLAATLGWMVLTLLVVGYLMVTR